MRNDDTSDCNLMEEVVINGQEDARSTSAYVRDAPDTPDDLRWGRQMALDFEEWQAAQEARQQYLQGDLIPAFEYQVRHKKPQVALKEPKSLTRLNLTTPIRDSQGDERFHCWTRKPELETVETVLRLTTMSEVEEWMANPTPDKRPVMLTKHRGELVEWSPPPNPELSRSHWSLCTYVNLGKVLQDEYNRDNPEFDEHGVCLNPYLGIELITKDATPASLEQVSDAMGKNKWAVTWHRRAVGNNDHWRRLVAPLAEKLDDPVLGPSCKAILQGMREALPFAPGPLKGTLFVNPDGSKHRTAGMAGHNAKAAYAKRHGLEDSLITMDRVQKVGERTSSWVIGTRKASDQTVSNYYDPDPAWTESKVRGEWVDSYLPSATVLHRIGAEPVMPMGAHRLTIRELERAIIAGAELVDNEAEALAAELEQSDVTPDPRLYAINLGYGADVRDTSALSHEEEYLNGVFMMMASSYDEEFLKQAGQLLCMEHQDPGMLRNHFLNGRGHLNVIANAILKFVGEDDIKRDDGHRYLPFVMNLLAQAPEWKPSLKQQISEMEAYPNIWGVDHSIPTGPNGACRIANWLNWS